jgi:carbon monoxide dehydrogenase subunit G
MLIENTFDVPAPVETVWAYLLDVGKVVPCMPGAELTETIDERNFKGKLVVKLGPVTMSWNGRVTMEEPDEGAHRVVLKAKGMEQRGKGSASATVTSTLSAVDGGTRVDVVQDVNIQGQAAQFGRGMMQDVSAKLTKKFADCLQANISAEEQAKTGGAREAAVRRVEATPPGGIRLGLGALAAAIGRFFRRLFRSRT